MWLFGSINEAIAGEDQAEKNPTIIEPNETANEAKICVLVTLDFSTFSDRKMSLCVSERNIVNKCTKIMLKFLWKMSIYNMLGMQIRRLWRRSVHHKK